MLAANTWTPRRPLAGFALAALLALGLAACNSGTNTPAPATPAEGNIAVELKNFAFIPKDIRVKAGEPVTFTFESTDIDHTFTTQDLGIDWIVKAGISASKTHTFTKTGAYRVTCTIPGHEGAGMSGSLQVE